MIRTGLRESEKFAFNYCRQLENAQDRQRSGGFLPPDPPG